MAKHLAPLSQEAHAKNVSAIRSADHSGPDTGKGRHTTPILSAHSLFEEAMAAMNRGQEGF